MLFSSLFQAGTFQALRELTRVRRTSLCRVGLDPHTPLDPNYLLLDFPKSKPRFHPSEGCPNCLGRRTTRYLAILSL
jgi:hypothetical protein